MRNSLRKKSLVLVFNFFFLASITVLASGGGGIIPGQGGGPVSAGCGTCTVSSTSERNDGRCLACQDEGDACMATWGTAPKCARNI